MRMLQLVAVVVVVGAVGAVSGLGGTIKVSVGRAAEQRAGGIGPGCDRSRPAIAHFPGGVALRKQPPRRTRPIPCMTLVGRTVEAADIGVSKTGAVFYAPRTDNTSPPPTNVYQGPEFVVRSGNLGASWTALSSGGPTTSGLVPPWMHVDPQTSRVWFLTAIKTTLCGARISWSDDDGRHWQTNPLAGCQPQSQGGEKIMEGPAARRAPKPHGYPHVVYYCGNGGLDTTATNLACYRSLDGGKTFRPVGAAPDPPGRAGQCGVNHVARPGNVGTDGYLYMPLDLCGDLGIAISRDEGGTWQRKMIARTDLQDVYTTGTAVDSSGNIYIVWIAGTSSYPANIGHRGLPYLIISRDHGLHWSRPMMVAAPGVRQAEHAAISATGNGRIAIAYDGSDSKAPSTSFNGYITETSNALVRRPVFFSASVNRPSRPLYPGSHIETFGDRQFYIGAAFAPDGTPWAGFHCAYEPSCPGERIGVAGRLAHP
jgi:hypothetical protein